MSNLCLKTATNRRHLQGFNKSFEADIIKCNRLIACESAVGVGVNQNLNETLVVGNSTGGEDIVMTSGDIMDGTQGDLILSDPGTIPIAGMNLVTSRLVGTASDTVGVVAGVIGGGGNTNGTGGIGALVGGNGGTVSGNGGQAVMISGEGISSGSDSGGINIFSVDKSNIGNTGNVELESGNTVSGNTGSVRIESGNASGGLSGSVGIESGNASGGLSGAVNINSGDSDTTTSGTMRVYTGSTTLAADTGSIRIFTGAALGTGDSGSMQIFSGTSVTGTTGQIELEAAQANTISSSGVVWSNGFHYIGDVTGQRGFGKMTAVGTASLGATIEISLIQSGGQIFTGTGSPTLDTGTSMDNGCARLHSTFGVFDTTPPEHLSFQWFICNSDAGNITVTSPGASHTTTGDMVVVANTSGTFLSRRIANTGSTVNPIWNTVRMS